MQSQLEHIPVAVTLSPWGNADAIREGLPATSYSHDSEPNHILPETKALGEPGVGQEPAGQREGIEAETWEAEAIYLPYSWAWLGPSLGSAWERMTQNRGP